MELSILAFCILCLILWRAGVLLYLAGNSRSKHVASAVVRTLCEMVVSSLCVWAVGAAIFLQQYNDWVGLDYRLLAGDQMKVLFVLCIVLTGTAPMVGSIAERGRFLLVPVLAALLSVVVIPVVWHLSAGGALHHRGSVDVAGALPILLCPAIVALVAAAMVGPRMNKYNRDGSSNAILGHSAVMMGAGVMLMLAGWLGYLLVAHQTANLPASQDMTALWRTPMSGFLAACAGSAAAMLYSYFRYRKVDLTLALLGLVAGMTSTAAGVGLVAPWIAVLLAAVAGVLGVWLAAWVDVRWRIDDAANLSVVIAVSSMLSLVVAPLAILTDWPDIARALIANGIGMAAGIVLAGVCTWGLLAAIRRGAPLRVSESAEYEGLDLSEHDQNAYPDFQQTMIKSYHLRER